MDRIEGETLPFRAEYSKSGRAACKKCKEPISKDVLRMAIMTKSRFFDGMQPNWHHFDCFFTKCRPKQAEDIAHFDSLRWADQEKIREKISSIVNGAPVPVPTGKGKGKGKKRTAAATAVSTGPIIKDLADFIVEYAKSNRSKCKVCEEQINKNEIRISKKDYESEAALQYGPHERWHHVDCFIKARDELGFWPGAAVLPGFMTLSPDDQKTLKNKIKEKTPPPADVTDNGVSPVKKPKQDGAKNDGLDEKEMKKQNDLMFKYRDNLRDLSKSELRALLEFNDQDIPEGEERALDRLADLMTFGSLSRCGKCNGGQLVYRSGFGYQCLGYLSEWSKCETQYLEPKRKLFKVPDDLKEYPFLASYKSKIRKRLFKVTQAAKKVTSTVTKPVLPLTGMEFVVHKCNTKKSDEVKKQIEGLGGKVVKTCVKNLAAVVSISEEIAKAKPVKVMKEAKESGIQVVGDDFFDTFTSTSTRNDVLTAITSKNIASWGSDLGQRIPEPSQDTVDHTSKSVYPSSSKSNMFKSDKSGTVQKLTLKDGLAVDPDSGIVSVAHVYRQGSDIYSVVCSLVDVQSQRNSYYKLQVLEGDKSNKYWLFRSWGRIGTTIGGNKCDRYETKQKAIEQFKSLFEEKTGNMWELRDDFIKVPGKMMMLDINYGEEKGMKKITPSDSYKSKLHKSVQELVTLLFDIEEMKKTMLEFELDLNKMPLGKLSQKQIKQAFSVLTELQNLLSSQDKHLVVDRTNRFYTLIPHDCGIDNPPLLDNDDIIKQKINMLNSLMDIEIAYKLLEQDDGDDSDNPIDSHYKKLQTEITVLDNKSDEFKMIEKYVQNTHAKTHSSYQLKIESVFKIERKGEASKYKKFNKLPNKKLLWHGSRLTNFAGILSQGLRIAPPEAPVSGYMFGKGVYFADMVSKSANYCCTSKTNPTGLLLLCEVALGQMHELLRANFIQKLPAGKHSVKGVGKTYPNPSEVAKTPTGAEVPLGKSVEDSQVIGSSLLYNEYIVYDVNQIKIQYLLKVKFVYNY